MAAKKGIGEKLVASAFDLCVEKGTWSGLSMPAIAAHAGVSLADACQASSSKNALLEIFALQVTTGVLAGGVADPDDPVKDRLFDVLMRRLDAMAPFKAALEIILRDSTRDPALVVCNAPGAWHSLVWMAQAAGLATDGIAGRLRVKGLAVIWAATLREWFNDDTEDMSKTMAALDRHLSQTDKVVNFLGQLPAKLRKSRPDFAATGQNP